MQRMGGLREQDPVAFFAVWLELSVILDERFLTRGAGLAFLSPKQ
jgi:hypothetical protein